jgi:hypothetical protein
MTASKTCASISQFARSPHLEITAHDPAKRDFGRPKLISFEAVA